VATAYEIDGVRSESFPCHADALGKVKPIYHALLGWQKALGSIERMGDLPKQARSYLDFIEEFTGAGIGHLSVGSERRQTIRLKD
jgi:adenylosuccinate synthase